MNDKAIVLDIHGIKCDACDYKDENVKVEEYEQWLNKPCPKCGANLLTEADLANTKMILKLVEIMNRTLPKPTEDEKMARISIEMNGAGNMDFKLKQ